MTLQNAFENLAVESKQDDAITALNAIVAAVADLDGNTDNIETLLGNIYTQVTSIAGAGHDYTSALNNILTQATAINANTDTLEAELTTLHTDLQTLNTTTSGLLTNTQLRATPVAVSGTVSTGGLTDAQLRASAVPVSGPLTDTQLRAAAVPVSGTVTANVGTTNGLALDATLTGGTQKSINRGGAKGTTTAADVTSTASGANHQGMDVVNYDGAGNVLTQGVTDAQLRATPLPVSGSVTTGGLTDGQLRASAVPVTGPLTDTQLRATAVPVSGPLTDTQLRATPVPVSGTVAISNASVEIANDVGNPIPVNGTVTANVGTTGGLALDATLTGGTQKAIARGGVKGATTAADVTSTASGANHQGLDVVSYDGSGNIVTPLTDAQLRATPVPISGTVSTGGLTDTQLRATAVPVTVGNFPATQPVSAAALPLPAGAATAAKQPALGTAGTPSADVISVQGEAGMTALKVDGSAVTQPVSGPLTDTQLRATAVPVLDATVNATLTGGAQRVQIVNSGNTVQGQTPAAPLYARPDGIVDTTNSTTANLGVGAVFLGSAFIDVLGVSEIALGIFASHASAVDGLQVEWSNDGVTVHDLDNYTIPAANGQGISFGPKFRFYRLRYTNGATLTTTLTIQSILKYGHSRSSTHRVIDSVSDNADAELVAAITKVRTGADTFVSLSGAADGSANVTVANDSSQKAATATLANVASSAASVVALAANASRKGAIFFNDSSATAYVSLGSAASITNFTYRMQPLSTLELPTPTYTGVIDAIWASATGAMRVTELT